MEKKLLLLGMLLSHGMHGYQLHELIEQYAGTSVKLTKANAYKLLSDMETYGWISHREEQQGNRPPRRVYSLTEEGKTAFNRLLRENLGSYPSPELPAAVGLDFVNALPKKDAVTLLEQRSQSVAAKFEQLDRVSEEIRNSHLAIEYLHRFYAAEMKSLSYIIGRLSEA